MTVKLEVELFFTTALTENTLNVKYLQNGERYYVGVKGGQI